ncbi:MAG TPA: penicillin amidase, partial [Prochlorococcaceae cyanobacterium Fu_MAG_134]|nr:penicillin amidase [Prochlorococcaceae cyanobacterium Fu_MAG_134]
MSKLLLFMQLILILVAIPVTANTKEVVEASNSSPTEIERDTEMINLGRDLGWIDATCSWFGWGHLSLE